KAANKENYEKELASVIQFYGDDFDKETLTMHLQIFQLLFEDTRHLVTLQCLREMFKSFTSVQLCSIQQVAKLYELLLVLPATNATSERSFSALRRIKTYLRSTMTQARLNNIMTLHVHQDMCDDLCLFRCLNDFFAANEVRITRFG